MKNRNYSVATVHCEGTEKSINSFLLVVVHKKAGSDCSSPAISHIFFCFFCFRNFYNALWYNSTMSCFLDALGFTAMFPLFGAEVRSSGSSLLQNMFPSHGDDCSYMVISQGIKN